MQLGISRDSPLIQISENRYEWIVADLAVHLAGGVHVAVHATLSGPQMAFQILDTDARTVLLSGDQGIAEQLGQAQVDWPDNVRFFSYEPVRSHESAEIVSNVGLIAQCLVNAWALSAADSAQHTGFE